MGVSLRASLRRQPRPAPAAGWLGLGLAALAWVAGGCAGFSAKPVGQKVEGRPMFYVATDGNDAWSGKIGRASCREKG